MCACVPAGEAKVKKTNVDRGGKPLGTMRHVLLQRGGEDRSGCTSVVSATHTGLGGGVAGVVAAVLGDKLVEGSCRCLLGEAGGW